MATKTANKKSALTKNGRKKNANHAVTATHVRVFLEGRGHQYDVTDIVARAMTDYMEKAPDMNPGTFDVYCKVEDECAYYAADGVGSPEYQCKLPLATNP